MKKQKEKNFTKKLKERGSIVKNNNYGITLIALVLTTKIKKQVSLISFRL